MTKRKENIFLAKIYQLSKFLYFSERDCKFRGTFPTDRIKGFIISNNSDKKSLEYLFDPLSYNSVSEILRKSNKQKILNSHVIEIEPCDEEIFSSREFGSSVKSMSMTEVQQHDVVIRNAFDPERVEYYCTCKKLFKNRKVRTIRNPVILSQWGLLGKNERYYCISTCPHICATDYYLRKNLKINYSGFDDGLDYMKPYVLSFIEALKKNPRIPDYMLDYAYTFYSSFFDRMKILFKNVKMYDDINVKQSVLNLFFHAKKDKGPEFIKKYFKSIRETIEIVGY